MFTRNVTLFFIIFFVLAVGSVNAQARIGAEESNKLVIEKANPVYPPLAKAAGLQGTVRLDLTISEAGAVISAKVIEGHPLLKDAAVGAAKKWKYREYLVNDKPVPFITTVDIVFSLGMSEAEYDKQLEISKKFFQEEDKCRDLLRSHKLTEAETTCKRAIQAAEQLSSDRVLEKMEVYELAGHVLMRQQRYQEALVSYSHALDFAQLNLTDKNAELGQLYGYLAIAQHSLSNLDRALELYRKAERSLQLAYTDMACDDCDDETIRMRQDYMKSLRSLIEYHLIAAQQANALTEIEEIKKLKQSLPK